MSRWNNGVDMKSLRSFNISSKAFQSATSFELTELEALETVEIGENCFNSTNSFALIGRTELNELRNRSSSTSISETG